MHIKHPSTAIPLTATAGQGQTPNADQPHSTGRLAAVPHRHPRKEEHAPEAGAHPKHRVRSPVVPTENVPTAKNP